MMKLTNFSYLLVFIMVSFSLELTPCQSLAKSHRMSTVVIIQDDQFIPKELTIVAGQTVTWINKGKHDHNVYSFKAGFNSGKIPPGKPYSYRFLYSGKYGYVCKYHTVMGFGMNGMVNVR